MPIRDYLEREQVNILLKHAHKSDARLLMLTMWRAGLRVSEAISLRYQDIRLDGDSPQLAVQRGKGKKPRYVPIHPELQEAFRVAFDYRRGGNRKELVFAISRQSAHKWVARAYASAVAAGELPGGRKVSCHTMRHSFARHMLLQRVPLNRLQIWMGHAELKTTMVYLQLVPDPEGVMTGIE